MAKPDLIPQPGLLAEFAAATRRDIDVDDMRGAIIAAQTGGWEWGRIVREVSRLVTAGEEPRDLRAAAADPTKTPRRSM